MNSKLILGVVVIIIAGALGWFFFSTDSSKTENSAATTTNETSSATSSVETSTSDEEKSEDSSDVNTVIFSDSGFNPQSLTVKSGETITWVNNSSSTVRIGSDNHPTHNTNRELTGAEFYIELALGESAKVQLKKTGEWGYHDHLKPSLTGTIIVQ